MDLPRISRRRKGRMSRASEHKDLSMDEQPPFDIIITLGQRLPLSDAFKDEIVVELRFKLMP